MHSHQPREQDPGNRAPADRAVAPPSKTPAELQRMAGNAALSRSRAAETDSAAGPHSAVPDILRSSGRALPSDVRAEMESRFGTSFSDVQVHADPKAHRAAASVQADAFTAGNHVVFGQAKYDPRTSAGKHLLAHELTHVVQQRSGPVAGTDAGQGLRISHPDDRFEQAAERNAHTVMRTPVAGRPSDPAEPSPTGAPDPVIQRNVGIELEFTNWRSTDSQGRPLEKKDVIVRRPGFELQADSSGGGSNIELVSDAPGSADRSAWDRSLDGMSQLLSELLSKKTTMGRLTLLKPTVGTSDPGMSDNRGQWLPRPLKASELNGGVSGRRIWVPRAASSCHLQVTAGVPLDSIPALVEELREAGATIALKGDVPSPDGGRAARERTRSVVAEALGIPTPSRELLGFALLLNHYLFRASLPGSEQFAKGTFQLMARTDFATLFSLLPEADRLRIQERLNEWTQSLAKEFAAGEAGTPADPVFGKPVKEGPGGKPAKITVTRDAWLRGMTQGHDLLTAKGAQEEPSHADLAGRVQVENAEQKWDDAVGESLKELELVFEGLGALGSKVDDVTSVPEGRDRRGAVLEIRNPGEVREDTWKEQAAAIYAAVEKAVREPEIGDTGAANG